MFRLVSLCLVLGISFLAFNATLTGQQPDAPPAESATQQQSDKASEDKEASQEKAQSNQPGPDRRESNETGRIDPANGEEIQQRRERPRRRRSREPFEEFSGDERRRRADGTRFRPPNPPGLTRIADDFDIWIDRVRKHVVVDGVVSIRQGPLEMFACPRGTKEHESIVAVNCPASFVHAGLLAIGAEPGHPVRFDPEYQPASGPVVDIWVVWIDKMGRNRKARAKDWIRDFRTGKPLEFDWVFGGSGFWKDEQTGENHYMADGGDFICVSNFTTAALDLTIESSSSTGGLLFEALTENIPNIGTHVRLVLIPDEKKP